MAYIINPECIGCHQCALECPVSAINYVKTKYEIDTEKCTECGICADICNISAITNTTESPVEPEKHDLRRRSCDLVVLGAGGGGLVAAVKAAELSGKKVIVLEKAKKPGGSAWYAHGFMIINSKWEQEAGLPDRRDDIIRRCLKETRWQLNPKLIRNYVYASGPFFDWLCEKGGADECFKLGEFHGMQGVIFPNRRFDNMLCRDPAIGPGWMGSYVIRKMLEQCQELGVEVLTEHKAVELITDETRKITGVLAEDPGGRTLLECRACVMATGGFAYSDEKLKKYWPQFFGDGEKVHRFAVPTVTGDAIELGEKIGAAIDYENLTVHLFGPVHHPFGYCGFRFALQPEIVNINLNGERWIDEGDYTNGSYLLDKQPGQISYGIVDEDTLTVIAERLIKNPPDGTDGWIFKDYRQELDEELKLDTPVRRANTLEDLAVQIGIDPANFVASIKRYNEFCAKSRDEDFFKRPDALRPIIKPPFYAFYGKLATDGAFGGVMVNENTQALNKEGIAIPGLYAVGDNASGWHLKSGTLLSDLTWAVCSGYIAGCHVGEYLKTKDEV